MGTPCAYTCPTCGRPCTEVEGCSKCLERRTVVRLCSYCQLPTRGIRYPHHKACKVAADRKRKAEVDL